METREWKYPEIHSNPHKGEWDNEPDKLQYLDPGTNYPCLIVRNGLGALCGYVGVSKNHPYFEKEYNDIPDLDVHGGITFTSKCQPNGHICHVVEEGEEEDIWWIGFDCCHIFDWYPLGEMNSIMGVYNMLDFADTVDAPKAYRNIDYVKKEIAKLAVQLKEVESGQK